MIDKAHETPESERWHIREISDISAVEAMTMICGTCHWYRYGFEANDGWACEKHAKYTDFCHSCDFWEKRVYEEE